MHCGYILLILFLVEQRLDYYRKDITELLAGRNKAQVVADLNERNILEKEQLDHFILTEQKLQSYTYLIDAVLTAGQVVAEKFYRYLLDTDVTDYFFKLVAPKGIIIIYIFTLHIYVCAVYLTVDLGTISIFL